MTAKQRRASERIANRRMQRLQARNQFFSRLVLRRGWDNRIVHINTFSIPVGRRYTMPAADAVWNLDGAENLGNAKVYNGAQLSALFGRNWPAGYAPDELFILDRRVVESVCAPPATS